MKTVASVVAAILVVIAAGVGVLLLTHSYYSIPPANSPAGTVLTYLADLQAGNCPAAPRLVWVTPRPSPRLLDEVDDDCGVDPSLEGAEATAVPATVPHLLVTWCSLADTVTATYQSDASFSPTAPGAPDSISFTSGTPHDVTWTVTVCQEAGGGWLHAARMARQGPRPRSLRRASPI